MSTAAGDGQSVCVESRDAATAQHVPDAVHAQRNQIQDHVRRQRFVLYHLVISASDDKIITIERQWTCKLSSRVLHAVLYR